MRLAKGVRPMCKGAMLLLAMSATRARAQRAGEGPVVLRLPSSARLAAMANAGIASSDGDAFLYNPGMLSVSRGMAASAQRYGSHGTAGALGSVTTSGSLTLGVGVQFVDWRAPAHSSYADAVRFAPTRLSDSGVVAASSSAFTLGIGRTIKGVRFGANIKYAEDRFGAAHDGTVAFDLGAMLSAGPGTLAFTAQNLGAGLRVGGSNGSLPRRAGIGYGTGLLSMFEHWDLGAQMQLTVENNWFVRPAGGVEFGYVPIEGVSLVMRAGLRLPRERDESLVTGGLGVVFDRISVDYAAEPFRDGRPVSHRVGVRLR